MTHTTLYLKGQGAFNEGLAVLVGKVGAVQFLEQEFGPSHPFTLQAKASISDERIFSGFMASLIMELQIALRFPMPLQRKDAKTGGGLSPVYRSLCRTQKPF